MTAEAAVAAAPTYELIVVPPPGSPDRDELLQQCYDLRVEVFHREQGFSLEDEFDEYARAPML